MLERQREFVADASHELRTPLDQRACEPELLAEELGGEQAESSRRPREPADALAVGDLTAAGARRAARGTARRTDLAEALTEAGRNWTGSR